MTGALAGSMACSCCKKTVCYRLQRCSWGSGPSQIITDTNLSEHVDKTVRIGDECYVVNVATNCTGAEPVTIDSVHDDCERCRCAVCGDDPTKDPCCDTAQETVVYQGINLCGCTAQPGGFSTLVEPAGGFDPNGTFCLTDGVLDIPNALRRRVWNSSTTCAGAPSIDTLYPVRVTRKQMWGTMPGNDRLWLFLNTEVDDCPNTVVWNNELTAATHDCFENISGSFVRYVVGRDGSVTRSPCCDLESP